jgi:predicted PurR-regulated permease PerM
MSTSRQLRSVAWGLVALALFVAFVWLAPSVCSLLLSGFIVAYVCAPVAVWLSRHMPRSLAAGLVLVGLAVVVVGIALLVVPVIVREWGRLAERLPEAFAYVQNVTIPWLETRIGFEVPDTGADLAQKVRDHLTTLGSRVGAPLLQLVGKTFGGVIGIAGAIANALLIPVLAFYLLANWGSIWPHIERLIPRDRVAYSTRLKEEIDAMLGGFVRGQLLVSAIIGTLQAVGLAIVGIEGGIVIGLLGGVLNLIPYLGVAIGLTLALLMAVLQFAGWAPIIGVLIVFAIVQVLEGVVITPRIVGDRVGLPPVLVILAILAGGEIFGFVGLLLAIPGAAVLRVVLREAVAAYRSSDTYRSRARHAPATAGARPPRREGDAGPRREGDARPRRRRRPRPSPRPEQRPEPRE